MKTRMNPWNRLVMLQCWLILGCGLGGTYLAHDRNIAVAALVYNTFVLSLVLRGSDREPIASQPSLESA